MNPLLSDSERALCAAAGAAADDLIVPILDGVEGTGALPDGLAARVEELLVAPTDDGDPGLLAISLRLEEIARRSAGVALAATGAALARWLGTADSVLVVANGVEATVEGDGATLSGAVALAPGAARATTLLIAIPTADGGLYSVPADAAGVTVEPTSETLGLRGADAAALRFDSAAAQVVQGATAALAADAQRVAHASVALGIATAALAASLEHIAAAREGGERLDRSQAVQWMIADIATETEAARATTREAAARLPGDADGSAAMARLLAAEAAVASTRRALQVIGAQGVVRGSGSERLYRDAKVMEILGGSNEDQLRTIADRLLPETA